MSKDEAGLAERAAQNGDHEAAEVEQEQANAVENVIGQISNTVTRRVPEADLDERDPDYIREHLPLVWLISSLYFRAEVRGLGNVPDGPVLLVGNHSGGNLTPDSTVFTLAFTTYFGAERPFHQLAHNLVLSHPLVGPFLRKFGTVAASHENADKALRSGAALMVYPGGDHEVHRPSWESARINFAGRKGFLRLALAEGVPIVPVVSIGGQETALFLTRGERISRALGLDRMFRLKVLPISIALPWGLNIGDFLGHIPLPAKITIEVLPPIDLKGEFGSNPDVDRVYDYVTDTMQQTLDQLAAERRFPVVG